MKQGKNLINPKWGLVGNIVISVTVFLTFGRLLGLVFDAQVIIAMVIAAIASGIAFLTTAFVVQITRGNSDSNSLHTRQASNLEGSNNG